MATTNWPWALNQPGYDYPAEIVRSQHYSATSGGNGVSSPTAMKVEAQTAPDGTVRIRPGGADVVSTYPGQEEQSYYSPEFQSKTLTVPPTGSSSGGRTDLIVRRVLDPDHEAHPEHSGEMTEEAAKDLYFQWYELIQGASASTNLSYPHVPLAEIRRPANTTIVNSSHIVDLRELADPQNDVHMRANNLIREDAQSLHRGTSVWPEDATHTVRFPAFATRLQVVANWGNVRHHSTAAVGSETYGLVRIFFVHPDGSEISTQESRFRTTIVMNDGRFGIVLGDNIAVPAKFRGRDVRVELRGNTISGANIYMDGDSSWAVQVFFEQEIA